MKKTYLTAVSLFSLSLADKKRLLTARTPTRAQRVVGAITKHLALVEKQASLALRADESYFSSTPGKPCRLRGRRIRKASRPHLGLTSTLPPQHGRTLELPTLPQGHDSRVRVCTLKPYGAVSVLPCREWMENSCIQWRTEKKTSSPELAATVKRTQAGPQNLRHERFADSLFKNHPVWYGAKRYPGGRAASVELQENSRLPPALRNDSLECCTSFFLALL